MVAANSEAQSLRESLVVRAACISLIVRGFSPPILRTCVQKKYLSFTKSRTCGGLKKTPSTAKYVTRVPPPPPPPPGSKTGRSEKGQPLRPLGHQSRPQATVRILTLGGPAQSEGVAVYPVFVLQFILIYYCNVFCQAIYVQVNGRQELGT